MVKVDCPWLFHAPPGRYPAFVEMQRSECESADDMGTEQLATVHCTSAQQSGGKSTPVEEMPQSGGNH